MKSVCSAVLSAAEELTVRFKTVKSAPMHVLYRVPGVSFSCRGTATLNITRLNAEEVKLLKEAQLC